MHLVGRTKLSIGWRLCLSLVCALSDACLATPRPRSKEHTSPIHKQGHKLGDISEVEGFLDPEVFYSEYVKSGKPVLFKNAAKAIPAFTKWTDEYLKTQHGTVVVDVEIGKKETRQQNVEFMPLEQFINAYRTEDIYMVQDVVASMKVDLLMPRCLQCGGFQDVLEAGVIWFSSGGTKSVLHYDAVDNINCLMDGEKSLLMIDKAHLNKVESGDDFVKEGGYHRVDVENVDLQKYPYFHDIEWWSADMKKGDCLFIPYRWYHTVSSSPGRNLAVNVWFVHRMWFNTTDCEEKRKREEIRDIAPMNEYSIAGLDNPHSAEKVRSEIFEPFEGLPHISLADAVDVWGNMKEPPPEVLQAFKHVDTNGDLKLDWSEVYTVDPLDFVQRYPFVFPGLEQMMEEQEEGEEEREEL